MNYKKALNILTYLYIFLPFLIFNFGWLKPIFSVPIFFILLVLIFKMIKTDTPYIANVNNKTIILITVIAIIWIYLSGIGNLVWQNNDHQWRNAIFNCLVHDNWPILKTYNSETRAFTYYCGFWLPSAIIGKLFGINAGYLFQIIWALYGVVIFFLLVSIYTKTDIIKATLLFIFFSGLDIIGVFFTTGSLNELFSTTHIEWWSSFQFSSFSTQLFWVFNQAIYGWILTILILIQKDNSKIFALLSTGLLTTTFPFIGLIPIAIYKTISNSNSINHFFQSILTKYNIIMGGTIGLISFLYLISTSQYQKISLAFFYRPTKEFLFLYMIFEMLEFLIFFPFISMKLIDKKLLMIISIELLTFPLITVGNSYDFCMRATIPSLVCLFLFINESIQNIDFSIRKIIFTIVLLLGSITALHEISRTTNESYKVFIEKQPLNEQFVSEDDLFINSQYYMHYSNSVSSKNIFYKYLSK